jgi:hypothetical protein
MNARKRCHYGMVMKVFPDMIDDPAPAGLKRMTKEEWPDQWQGLAVDIARHEGVIGGGVASGGVTGAGGVAKEVI